jgi:hypothetical protein
MAAVRAPSAWARAAALLLFALATGATCEDARRPEHLDPGRTGGALWLRGTLGEDVDCRLFRAEDGTTYSLTARLPSLPNGSKVCLVGILAEATSCLHTPTLEVRQVRAWSS